MRSDVSVGCANEDKTGSSVDWERVKEALHPALTWSQACACCCLWITA